MTDDARNEYKRRHRLAQTAKQTPAPPPTARPAWRDQAACRGMNTDLFFPVGETGWEALREAENAKEVCAGCPAKTDCLEYAIDTHQDGVWGGTTEKDRRRIREHNRKAAM